MKKLFPASLLLTCLLTSCVFATENIEICNAGFELPPKYSGGEVNNDSYELDNIFSIRCIDSNVAQAIGLWASECNSSQDLNIDGHPVRHFCQYNKYAHGNHSHAYFASGDSIYEIAWTGKEIDSDIENLIKNTPPSKIDDDAFYDGMDLCLDIYKQQKIDKLNKDSDYNYLEAKYNSQLDQQEQGNTRLKEILLTYYVNK